MITFEESLYISDGDYRYDNRLRDTMPGDIFYAETLNEDDYRVVDWHEVVWLNVELAEMARLIAEAEVHQEKSVPELLDGGWITYLGDGGGVRSGSGQLRFDLMLDRLPTSEMRFAERFTGVMKPTLRSNADVVGKPFMLYDAGTGVWVQEGKGSLKDGNNVAVAVSRMITGMLESLRIAEKVMMGFLYVVSPSPGPKPGTGVSATVRAVWQERNDRREENLRKIKKIEKFREGVENGKLTSILREVRAKLVEPATLWDSDMRWLVVGDGVVDLDKVVELDEKGESKYSLYDAFRRWRPDTYSTMAITEHLSTAINHQDTAWLAGVRKVLPDEDVRNYLQMRFGAALLGTPGVVGKSMVWQFGEPDTAKSSIMECIAGQNGVFSPYSIVATANSLTIAGERTGEAERTKAYARGKRYMIMDEIDAGTHLSQAQLKTLTGGNSVVGTAKYANSVQYLFTATMFMASNDEPTYPPGDVAFRNRIHVVPFRHKLWVRSKDPEKWEAAPEENRADETWKEKILSDPVERSAILLWVLDGLVKFSLSRGILVLPEAMREAADTFGSASDPVLHTIRSLLGLDDASEEPPVFRIWTDKEWEGAGFAAGDALTLKEFDQEFEFRLRELEYLRDGEVVPARYRTAAHKLIDSMGAAKKRVTIYPDGVKTSRWMFSRTTYLPSARRIARFLK